MHAAPCPTRSVSIANHDRRVPILAFDTNVASDVASFGEEDDLRFDGAHEVSQCERLLATWDEIIILTLFEWFVAERKIREGDLLEIEPELLADIGEDAPHTGLRPLRKRLSVRLAHYVQEIRLE